MTVIGQVDLMDHPAARNTTGEAEAASLNADHRAMEKARRCDARRGFRFPNARH
jgi:hypothetical protein